jgi:hypothetical protein
MSPMSGVRILVGLLVLALVLYAAWLLLGMFPVPAPVATIILIILFLIALAFLLNWSGLWRGPP